MKVIFSFHGYTITEVNHPEYKYWLASPKEGIGMTEDELLDYLNKAWEWLF